MKKLLIGIFGVILLSSCTRAEISDNSGYSIVMIDGCEYIKIENSYKEARSYSISLTHKGNCKNNIHCYSK